MHCARRLSELRSSSVSGGTADGGKGHEGSAPSYSAAGENHLHPGKPSLPSFIKIVWCRCVASAAIQLRKLVVRSTKFPAGAVQSAQWRELDSSSSRAPAESPRSCAVPVGSRSFASRPLAVGTADGGKNMRAPRPHTPRQVRITCTPANRVCRLL